MAQSSRDSDKSNNKTWLKLMLMQRVSRYSTVHATMLALPWLAPLRIYLLLLWMYATSQEWPLPSVETWTSQSSTLKSLPHPEPWTLKSLLQAHSPARTAPAVPTTLPMRLHAPEPSKRETLILTVAFASPNGSRNADSKAPTSTPKETAPKFAPAQPIMEKDHLDLPQNA